MEKKVEAFIKKHRMIQPGDRVIAGVSGGGDSMALLWMLKKWREKGLLELYVVHIHHGLRGEEADRDAELVERICRQEKLPFRIFRYSVARIAEEKKIGLEEAGRIVRQQAFRRVKEELEQEYGGTVKIALAHHGNDLAETMLHHMARGTGLRGLGGIKPVSGAYIRPFLCLEKEEIEHYLEEQQIPYETDSTNLGDAYTRNRIRHQVTETLQETVNPRAASHMAELAELASQADEFLEETAAALLDREGEARREEWLIKEPFFHEKEIIQTYGVHLVLKQLAGKSRDLTAAHIRSVRELADRQTGRRADLPYGLEAVRVYEGVLIKEKKRNPIQLPRCIEVQPPCTVFLDSGTLEMRIFSREDDKIPEKKYTKWLDYDKIKGNLCLRSRQEGDYLIVNSSGNRKKLKRYLIDEKIPGEQRDHLWLLASGQEILWVIGYRMSESCKVDSTTRRILEIKYKGGMSNERKNQYIDQ